MNWWIIAGIALLVVGVLVGAYYAWQQWLAGKASE